MPFPTTGLPTAGLPRRPAAAPGEPPSGVPSAPAVRDGLLTGLRVMGVCGWLMTAPAGLATLVHSDLRHHDHLIWPTVVLLLVQPVLLGGLVSRRLGHRWLVASGVALYVAIIGWMPHREELEPINWWAPGYWGTGWACWALLLVPQRLLNAVHVAAISLLMVLDVLLMHQRGVPLTGPNLAPVAWFGVPIALVTLFGQGVLHLAELADHERRRRAAAEQRQADEKARTDAHREAARLLHDHVLHALQAISRAGSQTRAEMVVPACREAVEAIDRASSTPDSVQLVDLIADDPALASTGARLQGDVDPLPPGVARALAAATHEALTNVQRHARATSTTVDVDQDGTQWRVVVRDDGRGFRPERLTTGRLGLRRSVHERLEDAGGVASVTSAPGEGTRVELRWPVVTEHVDWPRMGSAPMRRALARTAWPGALVTLAMLVTVGDLVHPTWWMALAALWSCGIIVWFIRRLQTRELNRAGIVVLLLTAEGIWWMNLLIAPEAPPNAYYLWLGWTAGTLLRLVVLQVRLRTGVALLAAWAVGQYAALWLVTGTDGLLRLHTAVTTDLGECAITLVALVVARRTIAARSAEQARAATMRRATGALQVAAHVEQYWSRRVTGIALPLLREVADGRRDVTDEALHAQAASLEATLRDEITLGPAHGELLVTLARLRQDGWQLRSTLDHRLSPEVAHDLVGLLDQLGRPAACGQELTLSASGTDLVALALAPSLTQLVLWRSIAVATGAVYDADPEFVRFRLPSGAMAA